MKNRLLVAALVIAVLVPAATAVAGARRTKTTAPTQTTTTPTISAIANPLAGASFYVDPKSNAWTTVNGWAATRPTDAERLKQIATQPTARWFGDWNTDVQGSVTRYVDKLSAAGKMPVMVSYNIPNRGCSGGGSKDAASYQSWIQAFANGIGTRAAVVILEPDALPAKCYTADRAAILKQAIQTFKANTATIVYLDAGHGNWLSATEAASRLNASGISLANGFSLNVSNFHPTDLNATYGNAVSALVGNKHFVIDTSRNGNGSNGETCNPPGRRIGTAPTTTTGHALADAFLWIKPPGESDGTCNGGLSGGGWMPEYALGLVTN